MLTTLPRTALRESPWNPRTTFDEDALQDLASSLQTAGQLTPLVVRPHPTESDAYEIAAGHRRFRASAIAGLDDLLCVVRPMDDQTFLEVLTIENLQREDVHPLEEADGYAQMLAHAPLTVADLAARVGKSPRYVRERLTLRALIPALRALYRAGHLTLGHALVLAPLDTPTQERTVREHDALFENQWVGEELTLVPEYDAPEPEDDDEELSEDEEAEEDLVTVVLARAAHRRHRIKSVAELKAWVREHVRLRTEADALQDLFPEAAQAVQSAPRVVELTMDRWIRRAPKKGETPILPSTDWKRVREGACDHVQLGVHVVGSARGQAHPVCVRATDCPVHWPKAARPASTEDGDEDDEFPLPRAASEWELRNQERQQKNAAWVPLVPGIVRVVEAFVRAASADGQGPLVAAMRQFGVDVAEAWEEQGEEDPEMEALAPSDVEPTPFPLAGSAEDIIRALVWTRLPIPGEHTYDLEDTCESLATWMGLSLAQLTKQAKQAMKAQAQQAVA